ncbi:MAG TPA: lysylphosphatidylglycerol synthase transmembrane domain-containing protein [Streptosporangiaceae bacterium]|nr:lysylphosphatidylglycerol synthase transmembrane domain-containing protein [Streptosporangiaceae bacterium]
MLRRISVRRISASPWVRAALLLMALGFAGYGLASQWPQVRSALPELAWYDVVGAALAVIAALGCQMLAWRALLTDLGSRLPMPAAVRVNFLGQLGKYVPGAVWAMAAQVSLAQDYRVPKRRSGAASLVSMAITLVVGLAMAGIVLPLASAGALRQYWWVLVCIPVLLVGLWPRVTKWGLDLALRLVKRPGLDRPLTLGGMGRAVGWTALAWVFYGLHAWLLVGDIAGKSLHVLLLAAGGYALAWAVGFLLIPFPGGIGPRELALIAVLSPVMPQGPALVVALASRVVMTVGDLVWAGVAVSVGRKGRGLIPEAAVTSDVDGTAVVAEAPEVLVVAEGPEVSGVTEASEAAGVQVAAEAEVARVWKGPKGRSRTASD